MIKKLPLFYFKPKIAFIDDDHLFLEAIKLTLENIFSCITFNTPHDATEFFDGYQSPLLNMNFMREFTESDIFGVRDHFPVDVDISAITNLHKMDEKNNDIAVVIIDYHMDEMNGFELCKRLNNFTGKKILLTGEASFEKAVEGFNHGLIDRFIRKDVNVSSVLQQTIQELMYEYFCDKSANVIAHLEASRPSVLSDERFINFFAEWCRLNDIEEYYLLNKLGAFLCKNNKGEFRYFIISSENDNHEFIKLHDELTDESADILTEVQAGKLIPFFGAHKESWEVETAEWRKHFYPAQKLQGREKYYWAVIDCDVA